MTAATKDWGLFRLHHGDCLDVLRTMPDNSVDSIVTDPPYGLSFMGKRWDYEVPQAATWAEAFRVLKPGGHMLAFFGSRTYHRGVVQIEDGGFEVFDQIMWVYGSGFPKSHNGEWGGTALKPAHEPICMARKPTPQTIAATWAQWGTGALNIDRCRIAGENPSAARRESARRSGNAPGRPGEYGSTIEDRTSPERYMEERAGEELGRWPANLIHDGSDEVLAAFPEAPGQMADASDTAPSAKTGRVYGPMARAGEPSANSGNDGVVGFKMRPGARRADSGSAARFFYCAKASKSDRGEGNVHPTVKPTDLMAYLCRLVTPPGGLVLDPFMGSGSTGKGAVKEGLQFVGIEREAEYLTIAERRIAHAAFGPLAFGTAA